MLAATTLIDLLTWLEGGDEERFPPLAESLLGWQGSRLRAQIATTGIIHLGKRQEQISPQTPDDELARLARAAALILQGPSLEALARDWSARAHTDPPFGRRLLRALGECVPILLKRHEGELCAAGLRLLEARAALPPDDLSPRGESRLNLDAALVEHLYRHFARQDPALADALRAWLRRSPDFVIAQKHRVLQTAALLAHWDVIEALLRSHNPYGDGVSDRGPAHARAATRRSQLSDYLLDRADQDAPEALGRLLLAALDLLQRDDAELLAPLSLLQALSRRVRAGLASPLAITSRASLREHLPRLRALAQQHPLAEVREAALATLQELTP